jgi:hypothetical protein
MLQWGFRAALEMAELRQQSLQKAFVHHGHTFEGGEAWP